MTRAAGLERSMKVARWMRIDLAAASVPQVHMCANLAPSTYRHPVRLKITQCAHNEYITVTSISDTPAF